MAEDAAESGDTERSLHKRAALARATAAFALAHRLTDPAHLLPLQCN